MAEQFRVLKGITIDAIDEGATEIRLEPGDTFDGFHVDDISDLLEIGAIELVKTPKPKPGAVK